MAGGVEARGCFWWAEELVPPNQLVPDSYVPGLLRVDEDGRISLELEGHLSSESWEFGFGLGEISKESRIRGLLITSGDKILLLGLDRNGTSAKSHAPSSEQYSASFCLLSERGCDLPPVDGKIFDELSIREVSISMAGYEEWLQLRSIDIRRHKGGVSFEYKQPTESRYTIHSGLLIFSYFLEDALLHNRNRASMNESAMATFRFTEPIGLEKVRNHFNAFENLLILFTITNEGLDWPAITFENGEKCTLFFGKRRKKSDSQKPMVPDCIRNFKQMCNEFGSVWDTWVRTCEKLGPAISLYFAVRRGAPLYLEHRFVSLIWAIEAFHRRKHLSDHQSPLKSKINRIIEQITLAKDKKWLMKRLRNAHEPSLAERIKDVLGCVSLGLEESRLHLFANECAQLRHDISHFGGLRQDAHSYDNFIRRVHVATPILEDLYQMTLLLEVGIDAKTLSEWFWEGFRSYVRKKRLQEVGLIPEAITPST